MKQRKARHKRQTWESYWIRQHLDKLRTEMLLRVNAMQFAVHLLEGTRLNTEDKAQMEAFRESQRQYLALNAPPVYRPTKFKGRI